MDIKGQAVLVTGGGSGIGADVARHLANAGAKVAVLDIGKDGAEAVAKEIGGLAIACDISDAKGGEEAVAKARAAHGPARILVNVAGILIPGRILGKDGPLPLEKFRKVVDVNLVGTFNMMRLAAADMFVILWSCSAFKSRTGSKRPAIVPVVTPSASGASVPCHKPWPHAGEEGQKKSSPGRMPVPYSAAYINVTSARCVCLTAAGSSRVVPEVY